MSLIKVLTELDNGNITELPAKIVETRDGDVFVIKYLSFAEKTDKYNRKVYKYEDETYEITNESVTEFLNSDSEIDLGFKHISGDEFIKYDSDSDEDYVPSSEEDDDEESETDEDEDEDTYTESDGYVESDD